MRQLLVGIFCVVAAYCSVTTTAHIHSTGLSATAWPTGIRLSTVLQNASGSAFVELCNASGSVVAVSSLEWAFQFPLVESTGVNASEVYIITYPISTGSATLYVLNATTMATLRTAVSTGLSYFDLQYSFRQQQFFGIAVTSAYGRMLSLFNLSTNPVGHTPIRALPYMWYVNASTFDGERDIYFGLLNNFPGQPNSTLQQQLAIGHFWDPQTANVTFLNLTASTATNGPLGTIHFITWVAATRQLIGATQLPGATVAFVDINIMTGEYTLITKTSPALVAPIMADVWMPHVFVWTNNGWTKQRQFGKLDLGLRSYSIQKTFTDTLVPTSIARLV